MVPVALTVLAIVACGTASKFLYGSTSESVVISVTVTDSSSSVSSSSDSSSSDSSSSSSSSSSASSAASSAASSVASDSSEPGGRRSRSSAARSSEPMHGAACEQPFGDVPADAWYEDELYELMNDGVIDCARRFHPEAPAVRAQYAKVIVKMNGITNPVNPVVPSFDDTVRGEWYYPYVEEAGQRWWMRGYGDCYGTRPCFVIPDVAATRAEAVAMILRSYGYDELNLAPAFDDVESYAWYRDVIQAAADRCILQGDDETGLVAPNRPVNRAEMVTLFSRARQDLRYGQDCGEKTHEAARDPLPTYRLFEASKSRDEAIRELLKFILLKIMF